jgi:Ser/Thr protein kinase RdoA (MazF antagonist)
MGISSLFKHVWTVVKLLPQAVADSRQKKRWERALPASAIQLWAGDPTSTKLLAVAKHAVYVFTAGGRELVMKVAVLGDRSEESILAEVDWVLHLAAGGVPVCRPVPSVHGLYVERILVKGRSKSVLAFTVEKAPGDPSGPAELMEWPSSLVEQWGAIAGRIHAASKTFAPPAELPFRQMISAETLAVAQKVVGRKNPILVEQLRAVIAAIGTLPRDREWFGMIHGDLTPVNLARDSDRLTLFDFESSSFCWFTYDLASPLYSLFAYARLQQMEDAIGKTSRFFASFLRGYVRENVLPVEAVECLPAFITFLALLNTVLFHDQKIESRTKKIADVVQEIATRQELQQGIDFSAMYQLALRPPRRSS